jgi:hypothetical protein
VKYKGARQSEILVYVNWGSDLSDRSHQVMMHYLHSISLQDCCLKFNMSVYLRMRGRTATMFN